MSTRSLAGREYSVAAKRVRVRGLLRSQRIYMWLRIFVETSERAGVRNVRKTCHHGTVAILSPVNSTWNAFACTLHRGKGRHWWEGENSRLERLADWRTTALPGQPELGTSDAVDGAGEL